MTASATGGALSVQITGTDTAVITEDADQDVLVEDANGTVVFFGPPAATLTSIAVTSSGTNDVTDLTEVGHSTHFTGLATIDVGAGTGAKVLFSGNYTTSGDQTYSAAVSLSGDTSLDSGGGIDFGNTIDGGFGLTNQSTSGVTFSGAVGSSAKLTTLSVNSGPTDLNASSVHTTGAQVYATAVTLTANTVLTSDTDAVDFDSTVDGAFSLTTSATSLTFFGGAVGAGARLTSLTTGGTGQTAITSAINTSGFQSYQQPLLLDGLSPGDVFALSTLGGDVTFGGTVDSFVGSGSTQFTLSIDTNGAGTTTFNGTVGATTGLDNLTVSGGAIDLNGGSVRTTGTQTYNGSTVLTADTALTTSSGNVTFSQTLDSGAGGAKALHVVANGTVTFSGSVGATPLASLAIDGIGMTVLAANVSTTGDQIYNESVSLNGNVALASQGGHVSFAQTVDSLAGTGRPLSGLTIDTTAAGTTTFDGSLGTEVELSNLSVTSGAIDLNGGSVQTTGAQSYSGPTLLTVDTTLTSTASGNVAFSQTLDSGADGPFALIVNTGGTTIFGGMVGGLGALAALTTDSAGTTAIDGGGVTTTGSQFYDDDVTLGSPSTVLNSTGGATVLFAQSLDGASALTVNTSGTTVLAGSAGATTLLNSLAITSGRARLHGTVATTGSQSYEGPVTLVGGATLSTRGGSVTFGSTIESLTLDGVVQSASLTIDTTNGGAAPGGGIVTFAGDIGDTAPLSTLSVTAAGPLTLTHSITTVGNQLFTVVPSPSAANGITLAAGGSLSSQGAVELRSGGNLTIAAGGSINAAAITLRGDFNNANSAATSVVLLAGNLQSPNVAVFTGDGNTTVNVVRTLANTATTITGGAGTDTYNFSSAAPATNGVLATLAGAITVNGASGNNMLVLGDTADVAGLPGTLTPSVITGFGMTNGVSYSNLQTIIFRLSAGPSEALTVVGTSPGSSVAINGGQTVVLGGGPGGLDQIAGPLAINGANILDIDDQLSTVPHTYDLSAGSFLRMGAGPSNTAAVTSASVPGQVGVTLANVKNIAINGGSTNNTYNIFLPLPPGQTVVVRGGGADNDVNVIGSAAGPNTAYVGNIGSGDPIQIGGVDCLTMYGAANQSNIFVNQTAVRSILIGGPGNDTLVGGSGPDVLFGGGGNDFLVAGGTAGSPGTDYTFADLLPAYLPNGTINPNIGDATVYPGLPGQSKIDGGGGVVVYFNHGTQVFNASSITMMDCDLPGSRALLQNIFNQALVSNECLATLTSPPAAPAAAATLAMVADYGPYVQRAYQNLLGRAADPAAFSYWTSQLAAGLSRLSFTNALTHSDEYYQRLVAADYQTYLGRVDNAALSFWANQFEQGLSDQQFESVLLGSAEYYSRSGATNSAWLDAVYRALLGRPADSQGENYWTGQLQAGVSRQAIAYQIATSSEAYSRVVEADYQTELSRAPAAADVNYWVAQLESGVSNESILASFVASDEFFSTS